MVHLLARLAPLALAACSLATSLDDVTPGCPEVAGTWDVSGPCGADVCIVTQTGCAATLRCSGGSVAYTGTVNRTVLHYAGINSEGAYGTCEGSIDGGTIEGTCATSGYPSCTFSASKR